MKSEDESEWRDEDSNWWDEDDEHPSEDPGEELESLIEHADPIIKHIQGRMGDRLRFVFRNFPIPNSHLHAQQAVEAAEAGGAQVKFWEMHDLLYERQGNLTDTDLHAYAVELDIDVGRFDREMAEHLYADRVEEDSMSRVRSGVSGTPTFYINVSGTTTLTSSTCCSTPWSAPPRTDEIPERGER